MTPYFASATGRHVQTGAVRSIPFPGPFLLLAVISLIVFVRS